MGPGYPQSPYGAPQTPGVPGAVPGAPGFAPRPGMPGAPGAPGMPAHGGMPMGGAPGMPAAPGGAGTKTCANGHVLPPGAMRCPYCPTPAARGPLPKTRVFDAKPEGEAEKPKPKPKPEPSKTKLIEIEETAPAVGWLVCISGKYKGKDFRIKEGKNTIGRDKTCDIVLDEDFISGRHANINHIRKDGENIFILVDLDSANGTFLNGNENPSSKEELVDSDKVVFGKTEFKFKCI